jgi:hypothetical protein
VSWFAYVGQNPLRYIDPSGLRRVDGDTAETLTVTGEGTNAHVHVEETVKIGESLLGEEIRGFVNPNTHTGLRPETDFWGRYEDLNSIIIEGVFVEWFSIYKSWNSTTAH